jgi:phosphatidylserine decarboxylase
MSPDLLKVLPQYLLPQHLLSGIAYRITRCRNPLLKNSLIRAFIRHYQVDMGEAVLPQPEDYAHFNAFFTRALRPGTRPLPDAAAAFVSPVDGCISQIGAIEEDTVVQAKGRRYSVKSLLGGDSGVSDAFHDGVFATLYLSPRDYHRIHMPLEGELRTMIYLPGRLFAVNPSTVRVVDQLFARNERVVCLFDTACGPLAVIFVGAMFVGSMETVWAGQITPTRLRAPRREGYPAGQYRFRRGEEIGRFNMGSTVIVLMARGRVRWLPEWQPGSLLHHGMVLGTVV